MPPPPPPPETIPDGTSDLWHQCQSALQPLPLEGELLRLVESQEQVATTHLVDDLAEQALLEDLLESSKPPRRLGTEGLHYLLATPFRYPPRPHGSRFGSRLTPGIFYAALGADTALAECAYYRFVFWTAMHAAPPSTRLLTRHTLFSARYRGTRCIQLQAPPCAEHQPVLRHPSDYGPTQRLGRALREAGIELIQYRSARDPAGGLNLALFDPAALASRRPENPEPWLCETRADRVVFSGPRGQAVQTFPRCVFEVAGGLPLPAG